MADTDPIRARRGDTLLIRCKLPDATGAFPDLSAAEWTIKFQVRRTPDAADAVATFEAADTDPAAIGTDPAETDGGYNCTLTASPAVTAQWQPGKYVADFQLTHATQGTHSVPTSGAMTFIVSADVTR